MKAAAYIRVSTVHQAKEGESLEMQAARAREIAAQHGWDLVEVYQDVMTGKSDKRPALKRFEQGLKAGEFQAVICYKVDRLGRSRKKLHEILEFIQHHNVQLVSMTQQIDTSTATGRMMLAILVDFAVFEVEQLSERVMDTMLHLGKSGKPTSGAAPIGYRHVPKSDGEPARLEVIEAEAAVVREMFRLYIETGSAAATAKRLNQQGLLTRGGKIWGTSTVTATVLNPLYGGERALLRYRQSRSGKKPSSARVVSQINDWVLMPGDHPPIVPPEIAAKARAIYLDKRQEHPRTRTGVNPWAGLVVCGVCGYRMLTYHPGHASLAFRCRVAMMQGCSQRSFSIDWLEVEVLPAISRALDGAVDQARKHSRKVVSIQPDRNRQLLALNRQLERLEVRFDNGIIGSDVYLAEHKRIKAEIASLQERELPRPKRLVLPAPLDQMYANLAHSPTATEDRRRLLRMVIDRIVITNDTAEVHMLPMPGVPEVVSVRRWPKGTKGQLRKASRVCEDCGDAERYYAKGRCVTCYRRHLRESYRSRS